MSRPGTQVLIRDTPPPRSAPTDVGVWFVAGIAERGPLDAELVTSLDGFTSKFGARVTYSLLYDAVETFFRERGTRLYVSRVVGPAATVATVALAGATGDTLTVNAKSPGEWGNDLSVDVVAGETAGTFIIVVKYLDVEVERSGELADEAAAVTWSEQSEWVDLVDDVGTGDPNVVAGRTLAGGADDHASATDASWKAALDRLTKDLGPGQVSMPGRTTAQAHADLLDHADTHERRALLDVPDTASAPTLKATALGLRTVNGRRKGALFGPWAIAPGVLPNTTRDVPYSAVQAALIAKHDGTGSPNEPAAGVNGETEWIQDVKYTWDDVTREDLNESGFNVARAVRGRVQTFGYRTLVDPVLDPNWVEFSASRLLMAIASKGDAIAERYVFAQIDGRGLKIGQFNSELAGMLVPYYEQGSLFGSTPEEAFLVDTGPQVNTPERIANRELRAVLSLRISHYAELVTLEVGYVPTTESIA